MDFWPEVVGVIIVAILVFFLTKWLGGIFTYEDKRKSGVMLTNQELAISDKFIKFAVWALIIQIPVLAISLPLAYLRWGPIYQYYLLGIFCYTIVAFLIGRRSLLKLKSNIRVMRIGLASVVVLCAIIWPITFFCWHRLKGNIPEYERIKYIHQRDLEKK